MEHFFVCAGELITMKNKGASSVAWVRNEARRGGLSGTPRHRIPAGQIRAVANPPRSGSATAAWVPPKKRPETCLHPNGRPPPAPFKRPLRRRTTVLSEGDGQVLRKRNTALPCLTQKPSCLDLGCGRSPRQLEVIMINGRDVGRTCASRQLGTVSS